jgi:hypothetical protein
MKIGIAGAALAAVALILSGCGDKPAGAPQAAQAVPAGQPPAAAPSAQAPTAADAPVTPGSASGAGAVRASGKSDGPEFSPPPAPAKAGEPAGEALMNQRHKELTK